MNKPYGFLYSAVLAIVLLNDCAYAEVRPEQTAVLANTASHESVELATMYAAARGIPREHVLKVFVAPNDEIDRQSYDTSLVMAVKKQLTERRLSEKIRVLVLTYGMPLRVEAPLAQEADREFAARAAKKMAQAQESIIQLIAAVQRLAQKEPALPDKPAGNQELLRAAESAFRSTAERLGHLEAGAEKQAKAREFGDLLLQLRGLAGLIPELKRASAAKDAQTAEQIARLEREFQLHLRMMQLIEQTSANENQDRAYRLAERMHGAAGVLALAQRDIESRHFKNADASVDSELSMLWWDQDMYRQSGMLPNPLYYGMTAEAPSLTMMPLLMVGRIDAPSLDLAKKIVEQSIAAEKNGLDGKVYVDARGLAASGAGDEPARWDQKLVDFGWFMRKHSPYSVEIDKYPPLLAEAADAAVYTGWYSLRNFSGDFSFVPGAIGYHIASEEAVSIHNSEEKGWCRNLLLRGITATLGAVAEPYLEAFPLPQDFIGLLMTGRYSLVEAYYMSVPHVSWRMVLIGDPLYNPWRGKALVEASELEIKRGAKMLDTAPVPPAEIPIGDPPAAIRQIRQNRKAAIVEIDNYFKRLDKPAQVTKTRS